MNFTFFHEYHVFFKNFIFFHVFVHAKGFPTEFDEFHILFHEFHAFLTYSCTFSWSSRCFPWISRFLPWISRVFHELHVFFMNCTFFSWISRCFPWISRFFHELHVFFMNCTFFSWSSRFFHEFQVFFMTFTFFSLISFHVFLYEFHVFFMNFRFFSWISGVFHEFHVFFINFMFFFMNFTFFFMNFMFFFMNFTFFSWISRFFSWVSRVSHVFVHARGFEPRTKENIGNLVLAHIFGRCIPILQLKLVKKEVFKYIFAKMYTNTANQKDCGMDPPPHPPLGTWMERLQALKVLSDISVVFSTYSHRKFLASFAFMNWMITTNQSELLHISMAILIQTVRHLIWTQVTQAHLFSNQNFENPQSNTSAPRHHCTHELTETGCSPTGFACQIWVQDLPKTRNAIRSHWLMGPKSGSHTGWDAVPNISKIASIHQYPMIHGCLLMHYHDIHIFTGAELCPSIYTWSQNDLL